MFNIVQVVIGLAFVFLLPGYTMVCAVFPRRGELDPEYDTVYRLALGMGSSLVITIFVGFALNAISTEETQYVRSGPLWIVLSALTAIFLLIGWYRGAYPSAGLIHPSLYRPPAGYRSRLPARKEFDRKRSLDRLIMEREQLVSDLRKFGERSAGANAQTKLYYRKRMDVSRERMDKINAEIKKLEKAGE